MHTPPSIRARRDQSGKDENAPCPENAAELRHACRQRRHAFHEPVHANDLWIAASAVQVGAPLRAADAVFDDVPGLSFVTVPVPTIAFGARLSRRARMRMPSRLLTLITSSAPTRWRFSPRRGFLPWAHPTRSTQM